MIHPTNQWCLLRLPAEERIEAEEEREDEESEQAALLQSRSRTFGSISGSIKGDDESDGSDGSFGNFIRKWFGRREREEGAA